MRNRALFLDKDGVLNTDATFKGNTFHPVLNAEAAPVIEAYRHAGFCIFVVTNQTCVSRGLVTENELVVSFEEFQKKLLLLNTNAIIDRFYYCPHHPSATVQRYRTNCNCRKPQPGMLHQASSDFSIDLAKSFFVGDRSSDIVAGNLAGCTSILLASENLKEPFIETDLQFDEDLLVPDHQIQNIRELRELIT